jgi:hypothetical protein
MNESSGGQKTLISKLLYALSLILLGFGLVNLGWAAWPAPTDARTFAIPAGTLPGAPSGTDYASLADYQMQVSWPRWIRAGETGQILVTLSEVDLPEEEVLEQETQILLVEPSLIGLPVDPPGRVQINIGSGQDLRQRWTVDGAIAGEYPGKLVVSFGFFDESLGQIAAVPVAVVDFSVQVVALWGVGRGLALWLGVVGMVLWGALFILGRVAAGEQG